MENIRFSIKWRLVFAVVLPVFLVVLLFIIFTLNQNQSFFNSSLKRDAKAIISPFHVQLSNSLTGARNNKQQLVQLGVKTSGPIHFSTLIESHTDLSSIYFVGSNGERIFSTGDITPSNQQIKDLIEVVSTTPSSIGKGYSAVTIPFIRDKNVYGYSILTFKTIHYESQYDNLLLTTIVILALASLIGIFGAYWIGDRITKPIISLANHIKQPEKFMLNINKNKHDEVSVLTHSFQEMQKKIDRQIKVLNKEIDVRVKAEEHIQNVAFYDVLTSLPNRHLFNNRLNTAIAIADQRKTDLAVMFIDIDGFKLINDLYGHPTGDSLLRLLGKKLSHRFRSEDTVARFGGDEFIAIVAASNVAELSVLTDDIIKICENITEVDGCRISISASIGISLYPEQGKSATDLLKHADMAMYNAKEQSGGKAVLFKDFMLIRIEEKAHLIEDLHIAVQKNQFELHYQPILELKTKKVVGAEALVRWKHPQKRLLYPDKFIAIAEKSDLIVDIGNWVLEESFRQFQSWKSTVGNNTLESISVNVSPKQIERDDFVKNITKIIYKTGIKPNNIEIELTENILMAKYRGCQERLKEIREMGIRIAIDDFGTGYSSLSYLLQFPIDTLKIDRSFVIGCSSEKSKIGILKAITGVAKTMSIGTIAEGIETEEDCSIVIGHGCKLGQGYFFSKPLTANKFKNYIKRKHT